MNDTFLDKILSAKRARVQQLKADADGSDVEKRARAYRQDAVPHRLMAALGRPGGTHVIAEIKRSSPSKGVIRADIDVAELARKYKHGGAAAISVLTEEDFFGGSVEDLRATRHAVDIPILRKDFIVDEYQLYESALAGADSILLIVAALEMGELEGFKRIASEELGMDVMVEVHDAQEMEVAASIGAKIIGVNNRNLKTFEVSLDVSRNLREVAPPNSVLVAESGIASRADIVELMNLGYSGFLIGETLMRSGDPEGELQQLTGKGD